MKVYIRIKGGTKTEPRMRVILSEKDLDEIKNGGAIIVEQILVTCEGGAFAPIIKKVECDGR